MVGVGSRFDDHVVHVYFEHVSYLVAEDFIHHSLVRRPCVFQTEEHYVVVVIARAGDESNAMLVAHCQLDLIIARVGVHK